jgi:hypothetical protein
VSTALVQRAPVCWGEGEGGGVVCVSSGSVLVDSCLGRSSNTGGWMLTEKEGGQNYTALHSSHCTYKRTAVHSPATAYDTSTPTLVVPLQKPEPAAAPALHTQQCCTQVVHIALLDMP